MPTDNKHLETEYMVCWAGSDFAIGLLTDAMNLLGAVTEVEKYGGSEKSNILQKAIICGFGEDLAKEFFEHAVTTRNLADRMAAALRDRKKDWKMVANFWPKH